MGVGPPYMGGYMIIGMQWDCQTHLMEFYGLSDSFYHIVDLYGVFDRLKVRECS